MNMNTTRRLDDNFNTALATLSLALLFGTGISAAHGDLLGRGQSPASAAAPMMAKAKVTPAPAPAVVVLAAR